MYGIAPIVFDAAGLQHLQQVTLGKLTRSRIRLKSYFPRPKLLIVGCGDIGHRLAALMSQFGFDVTGIRRNLPADGISESASFQLSQCDATNEEQLSQILSHGFDCIVATFTPGRGKPLEDAYRASYVAGANVLEKCIKSSAVPAKRVLWVSSTSVYGQSDGSWVDEHSSAEPKRASAVLLKQAEDILLNSSLPCSVVRFSGIYGPGRTQLLNSLKTAKPIGHGYTNRIHVDDCAGVLAHLLRRESPLEPIYLATDHLPVSGREVRKYIAEKLSVVEPPYVDTEGDDQGKRCNNRRLLDTGYRFIHPDYRSGWSALLKGP